MANIESTATIHHAVRDTIEYLTAANSPVIEAYQEQIASLPFILDEEEVAHAFARMFGVQLPKFWEAFRDDYKNNSKSNSRELAYKKLRGMAIIANSGGVIIGLRSGATFEDSLVCQSYELEFAKEVLRTSVEPNIFEGSFESALALSLVAEVDKYQPRPVTDACVINASIRLTQLSCQLALQNGFDIKKLF